MASDDGGKSIRRIHGHCQKTRLCRGYFTAFARELRLNENLLYIPCTPFPLPFFSPVHILINGSFLRECNARETKSQRRDRSRFIALSLPLFLSLSSLPPSLPLSLSLSLAFYLSFRTRVHCVRPNRDMRNFHVEVTFYASLFFISHDVETVILLFFSHLDICVFSENA